MRSLAVLACVAACMPSSPSPAPADKAAPQSSATSAATPAPSASVIDRADAAPSGAIDRADGRSGSRPMSAACRPAAIPRHEPAKRAHTLEGLVELLHDPDVAIADVSREFGAAQDSTTSTTSYDIAMPLPDVARVVIGWRRVQNREYLTRADVEFVPSKQPTVAELAERLGMKGQVGGSPVSNSCVDGRCLSVAFKYPREPHTMSFYLADSNRAGVVGSKDVAKLPVGKMFFFTLDGNCTTGAPQSAPVALPDPAPGPERDLGVAVLAAARELVREPNDPARIEKALGPFGRVRVDHNDISKFSWVRFFPDERKPIAPFCFSGFRYVRDRDLLCHITNTNDHLYEIDGNTTHRLFMKVELGSPYGKAADHISFIELILMPKNWSGVVF